MSVKVGSSGQAATLNSLRTGFCRTWAPCEPLIREAPPVLKRLQEQNKAEDLQLPSARTFQMVPMTERLRRDEQTSEEEASVSYHHHVSGERVGQVRDGGVAVGVGRLTLGTVGRLVASAEPRERTNQGPERADQVQPQPGWPLEKTKLS